ncbi:MAG: translation elongation factor Ts [Planctomycetota bacterium]
MPAVTAKEVSELRKATGAGLMDCKKALQESDGDFEGALDFLRKKGAKVAAKRADREANEGVVVALVEGNKGLVLSLSSETDFVAKNEDFVAFANELARIGMEQGISDRDAMLAYEMDGVPVSEKLVEKTGTIGEKIELSDYQVIEGDNLTSYIHAGAKIGVLVAYKDGGADGADAFFRNLAMHIAAMAPVGMTPESFTLEFAEKEAEALRGQIQVENEDRERLGKPLKNVPQYASSVQLTPEVMAKVEADIKAELQAEGKPEQIWDKIVPGKIERFIADNTLLDQERCLLSQFYALDQTGSQRVAEAIKEFHENAEVIDFRRVAVG